MRLIRYDNANYDPFSDIERWFERAFGDLGRPYSAALAAPSSFRVDLYSDEDNRYVVAELPGIRKKDISIELENAVLTITAHRTMKEGDNEQTFNYSRSITVGDDVDANKVKARLEDGLLRVTLPKAETRKPKQITVS